MGKVFDDIQKQLLPCKHHDYQSHCQTMCTIRSANSPPRRERNSVSPLGIVFNVWRRTNNRWVIVFEAFYLKWCTFWSHPSEANYITEENRDTWKALSLNGFSNLQFVCYRPVQTNVYQILHASKCTANGFKFWKPFYIIDIVGVKAVPFKGYSPLLTTYLGNIL